MVKNLKKRENVKTGMSTTEYLQIDLGSYFASAEDEINQILSGKIERNDEIVESVIAKLEKCLRMVESEALFSKNEEFDDIQTESLKFLAINYYIGKMNGQIANLFLRKNHLLEAKKAFTFFLDSCTKLKILNKHDIVSDDYPRTAEDLRAYKIFKYKKEKEGQQKMEKLRKLLYPEDLKSQSNCNLSAYTKVQSIESVNRNDNISNINTNSNSSSCRSKNQQSLTEANTDLEEELRELILLQLQSFCRDSYDELSSITKEQKLLEHMEDLRELEELNTNMNHNQLSNNSSSNSSSSSSSSSGKNNRQMHNQQYFVPGLPSAPDQKTSSEGITITKTAKVGDQLVMTREVIKSNVFTPRMQGPSMTIEEFGDLQLQQLQQQQQVQQQSLLQYQNNNDEQKPIRRIKELEAEGEEDNYELLDKATIADRQWDDWKDSVEKGSGNKMGKRF